MEKSSIILSKIYGCTRKYEYRKKTYKYFHLSEEYKAIFSKKYDIFISLGSSCFFPIQLKHRGLRYCSLPLDWVWNPNHLSIITRYFANGFKNFFLYENLEEITLEEERGSGSPIQYKDSITGIRFIHHFARYKHVENEYIIRRKKIDKRIERLYSIMEESDKILFLAEGADSYNNGIIPIEQIGKTQRVLSKLFNNTEIHILFLQRNSTIKENNIQVEYNPKITILKIPSYTYTSNSFLDREYAINTHTFFNEYKLSPKGIEIAKKYIHTLQTDD